MKTKPRLTSRFTSTLVGALLGTIAALLTWACLFLLATFDDTSHNWKGILLVFGIVLPIVCVPCGVVASRSHENGQNYFMANFGITCLLTIVLSATIFAVFSLPVWAFVLIAIPAFFGCGFVVERYLSGTINKTVRWLANEPPITG